MPFGLGFFGAQTAFLYVNNNGDVTFEDPISAFSPFAIAANTRSLSAPFFADFDTLGDTSRAVTYGLGNGGLSNDIQGFAFGTPDLTGKLRAERVQACNGRESSLLYEAVDLAGNAARCTAVVRVPR